MAELKKKTEAVCCRCGSENAVELGGQYYCLACYTVMGSCCLEFGADDIWRFTPEEERYPQPEKTEAKPK
jgi:hypothetical protein